MFLTGFNVLKQ